MSGSNKPKCFLEGFGFSYDSWGETVAVFYRDKEIVALMPMGLRLSGGCKLFGRVFKGSKLFDEVSSGMREAMCIICVSSNSLTFYTSIFDKDSIAKEFKGLRCPCSLCDACIYGSASFVNPHQDFFEVYIDPDRYTVCRELPRVYTRAFGALVEALVWYTKIPYVDCEKLGEVLKRIEHCVETVYRSTENGLQRKAISTVYSKALDLVKTVEGSRCRPRDKNI